MTDQTSASENPTQPDAGEMPELPYIPNNPHDRN